MNRRKFIRNTVLAGTGGLLVPGMQMSPFTGGELLYNGIRLPAIWPPRDMKSQYIPMPVPYLESIPKVIPIPIGRQLFVDNFLIQKTTLTRVFHAAQKIPLNPVFKAEVPAEMREDKLKGACPKDGGVWWDDLDQQYKMWYEASWAGTMALAVSKDGLNWERPDLNIIKGTNIIIPDIIPDSTTVFIDYHTKDPRQRYKMFLRRPNHAGEHRALCMVSADGINWSNPVFSGICGDRSTMFYNPFRRKWVYSIRSTKELGPAPFGRSRYYYEHNDFLKGADWDNKCVYWTSADYLDKADPDIGERPQLYNLSAVGYESLMVGFYQIHLGPPNDDCMLRGEPKITELMISFSRDGFHWDRPDRNAFIKASREPGFWDRGYVQSVGGICSVVGDELRFYYIGYKGDFNNKNPRGSKNGMYANGSTGMAVLRRDGFASMETKSTGELLTRPISFEGSFLFVNVDCPNGKLMVEILDERMNIISPFSLENCKALSVNSTIKKVEWEDTDDLQALKGKPVRFRFRLDNGKLYSFWVSSGENGASRGFTAAGGPGLFNGIDDKGLQSYKKANEFTRLVKL